VAQDEINFRVALLPPNSAFLAPLSSVPAFEIASALAPKTEKPPRHSCAPAASLKYLSADL